MSAADTISGVQPAPTSVADRLYPSTPSAAPAQVKPQGDPAQAVADRLYAAPPAPKEETLPPAVAELRNDPMRRMFDAGKTYEYTGIKTLFEGQANAPDEVRSWGEILADHDASPQEASEMVQLVRTVRQQLPTAETAAAWKQQSLSSLRAQYGDKTDAVIADARRLVARDPRVNDLLVRSQLGSHPRVVAMIVAKAAEMRRAGRLK